MSLQPIPAITQSGYSSYGFVVSYNNATSVYIGEGVCRDSNNRIDIVIGSKPAIGAETPVPLLLDATKNGANGLDVGTLQPLKVYDIFVIADSSGYHPPAALMCLDSAIPILPLGYDSKRLQFFVTTNNTGAIIPFINLGYGNDKTSFFPSSLPIAQGYTSTDVVYLTLGSILPSTGLSNNYSDISLTINFGCDITPTTPGTNLNINNIYNIYGQVASVKTAEFISGLPVSYQGSTPVLQVYNGQPGATSNIYLYSYSFSI